MRCFTKNFTAALGFAGGFSSRFLFPLLGAVAFAVLSGSLVWM
jgi:hypothetical protein